MPNSQSAGFIRVDFVDGVSVKIRQGKVERIVATGFSRGRDAMPNGKRHQAPPAVAVKIRGLIAGKPHRDKTHVRNPFEHPDKCLKILVTPHIPF